MFKTFPEFSKLTFADREAYDALIKDYPPLGDISFSSLMLWWEPMGGLAIARLNGNLVISYWLPGSDEHSGLSLIGTENVDESICAIFDYLRDQGEQPRLVNVPEFVVNSMQYPELFVFRSDRGDDEYLLSTAKFANMDKMPAYMRIRARKFEGMTGEGRIDLKILDLSSPRNRRLLLETTADWPLKGVNNINKLERETLPHTIEHGAAIGGGALCLYVDDTLQAYCLYFPTHSPEHVVIGHARVNYDISLIFDYTTHAFCKYLAGKGVEYINIHADNGSLKMRTLKIALKSEHFFRKYSIEPAQDQHV